MRELVVTLAILSIVGACLFAMTWAGGPARIVVENQSGSTLKDLVVSGVGFQFEVDQLSSGDAFCRTAQGFSESGLAFEATSRSGRIEASDLTYLEGSGGYFVRLIVLAGGEIRVETDPRPFSIRSCSQPE